jgi:hypothetical protein
MIRPKFTRSDIRKEFLNRTRIIDETIINRLTFIGETFINNARANGNYLDQTGNLRSSIGYVVLKDGKKRSISTFNNTSSASEGPVSGKKLIQEMSKQFNSGYVLIVVAGMDYAAAVESKGKDVLTSSSIKAKKELRRAFKSFLG